MLGSAVVTVAGALAVLPRCRALRVLVLAYTAQAGSALEAVAPWRRFAGEGGQRPTGRVDVRCRAAMRPGQAM